MTIKKLRGLFSVSLVLVSVLASTLSCQSSNGKPVKIQYTAMELNGGVEVLMDVDLNYAIKGKISRYYRELRRHFLEQRMFHNGVRKLKQGLEIKFRTLQQRNIVSTYLAKNYKEFVLANSDKEGAFILTATISNTKVAEQKKFMVKKNIVALHRKFTELRVVDPIVTARGKNRVLVQLPGLHNTEQVQSLIDKHATVESRPLSEDHDSYISGGHKRAEPLPPGTEILYERRTNRPYLLKKEVTWSGEHVVNAVAGFSSGIGALTPSVHITLNDEGGKRNHAVSSKLLNKRVAIVFIETVPDIITVDGKKKRINNIVKRIINVAYIRSPLYKRFQISGMADTEQAHKVAMFLRAGNLAAPMTTVEIRVLGPSLWVGNI